MTVREVMATVDIEKLAQIYIQLGSTQLRAEDVPNYLKHLLTENASEFSASTEFVLLGVTCPDNVCRVMPVDLNYLNALLCGRCPITGLPEMPDLEAISAYAILEMQPRRFPQVDKLTRILCCRPKEA